MAVEGRGSGDGGGVVRVRLSEGMVDVIAGMLWRSWEESLSQTVKAVQGAF